MPASIIIFLTLSFMISSYIWVFFDSKAIGVKKGQVKGLGDMNREDWLRTFLPMWIFALPLYLIKRPEFKRANNIVGNDWKPLIYASLFFIPCLSYKIYHVANLYISCETEIRTFCEDANGFEKVFRCLLEKAYQEHESGISAACINSFDGI